MRLNFNNNVVIGNWEFTTAVVAPSKKPLVSTYITLVTKGDKKVSFDIMPIEDGHYAINTPHRKSGMSSEYHFKYAKLIHNVLAEVKSRLENKVTEEPVEEEAPTSEDMAEANADKPSDQERDRCLGITAAGKRCKNSTPSGHDLCHIHQKSADIVSSK